MQPTNTTHCDPLTEKRASLMTAMGEKRPTGHLASALHIAGCRATKVHRRTHPKACRRLRDLGRAPAFELGSDAISSQQQSYYRGRAAEERAAAAGASDPKLAELHDRMAQFFESLDRELDRPRHSIAPGW